MKKSTKGAIAAGAAAVLLLGGAGTLAYWTDDATVDGGTVSSGSIDLSGVTCATTWSYADAVGTGAVTAIVPGDTIVKQCTGTLTLVGDHIGADVTLSDASISSVKTLDEELTVDAALTSPAAAITEPGSYNVTIDITVDFPYGGPVTTPPQTGAKNGSQIDTATLSVLELVAVQTHS